MLAAHLAANPKARRAARWGCLLTVGIPMVVVCLLVLSVLTTDNAGASGLPGVNCSPLGASTTQVGQWGPEQMSNAATIVAVGRAQQVPEQGQVVAVTAAMTESRLRNLPSGDRDSVGLFQMRPSQGWGTIAQLTDPTYAAGKFYAVLAAVPNWQGMPAGDAAQAVERSAFPDRYAVFETDARQVLGALTGVSCAAWNGNGGGGAGGSPAGGRAQKVLAAALSQLGVRYAWGGGTAQGPSPGSGVDTGVVGFDCSGLALYAYAQVGIAVPHQTQAIWSAFPPTITDPAQVQPGDLILLSANGSPGGIHHVGIYLGNGQVVHAPQSGDVVKVTSGIWAPGSYWTSQFLGAVRPGT
jgi:cell wall-associated NlpC family hydrolase